MYRGIVFAIATALVGNICFDVGRARSAAPDHSAATPQNTSAIPAADSAIVATIQALAPNTAVTLPTAKLAGKELETWRKEFYENGPDGRDYSIKMPYVTERKSAFYCGGNHGTPHKLADAWEFHLGSNTWTLLAPPEGGDPKSVIGLYGDLREGKKAEALDLVKKHVALVDGCLVTRNTHGPINTSHTWDGLCYDPGAHRILWAAPATGIKQPILESLYAEANGVPIDELRAKLSPGMEQFWMFDYATGCWKRHTGAKPYPRISFTCTLTYLSDVKKTFYYMSESRETWLYDSAANRWEQLKPKGVEHDDDTPAMELMAAYSPRHRKVVCVQGANTWTFDVTTSTWARLPADDGNNAQDHRGFFGYDEKHDIFLLYQTLKPERVRTFSLASGKWTTPKLLGDPPPEPKSRIQGYFDPTYGVLVCCNRLKTWVLRIGSD
jgi:hypothetical protein